MISNTGIYSLYIINASGGLIYNRLFVPHPHMQSNDLLRYASTFHSIHAIASVSIKVHPISNIQSQQQPFMSAYGDDDIQLPAKGNIGITSMESTDIRLACYQTYSGMKFIVVSHITVQQQTLDRLLHSIYVIYCDYVLKNPFYEYENPIRIPLFDNKIQQLVGR
jgi:hypothetical protein